MAEIHENSALRLRANGREAAAERVERLAVNARDRIEQPAAMERMYSLAQRLHPAINADPAFAAHRAIAAASGFRAVLSTPLIDSAGVLRGVVSTHFRRPHRPAAHELRLTETYAQLVADAIARRLDAAQPGP